jgi:hypothetical protein
MGSRIIRKVDFNAKVYGGGGGNGLLPNLEKAMGIAVADASAEIVIRTKRGSDVDGNSFKAYTPAYAKHRREKLKRQSDRVNLQVTGQMLAAIRQKVKAVGNKVIGTIYFGDETNRLKAEGNSRYRNFFGLSENQVKTILETLKTETNKR